jgi:hypothetical protein
MAEIHINVGLVALARGFITLETFARTMGTLAQNGQAQSIRDLWIGPGRLDEGQFASVLDAIGPQSGRDTMLYSVESAQHAIPKVLNTDPTVRIKAPMEQLKTAAVGSATAPTATSLVPPIPPQQRSTLPPLANEMLGSRYKKLFPLGAGGLGEVVACEDLVLGRTVAVKAGTRRAAWTRIRRR